MRARRIALLALPILLGVASAEEKALTAKASTKDSRVVLLELYTSQG